MKINLHAPLFRVVVFLNSISVKVPKIKEKDGRTCGCRTQQNAPAVSECRVHSGIDRCQRTGALREICCSLGLHKFGFFFLKYCLFPLLDIYRIAMWFWLHCSTDKFWGRSALSRVWCGSWGLAWSPSGTALPYLLLLCHWRSSGYFRISYTCSL